MNKLNSFEDEEKIINSCILKNNDNEENENQKIPILELQINQKYEYTSNQ